MGIGELHLLVFQVKELAVKAFNGGFLQLAASSWQIEDAYNQDKESFNLTLFKEKKTTQVSTYQQASA